MKLHVGTSGYGYKEWKGIFYPEKISAKEMLRFYAERFDAVEINYTYYHMPTERLLASWGEQVPEQFAFVFKAPQVITHRKRLKGVDEEAEYFFSTLSLLGGKLGAVLCQFPATFPANLPRLEAFLRLIPPDIRCAFEFRNQSWIEAGVAELLHANRHTLCIADTDESQVKEIGHTASWGYLRLRRSSYTEADLALWAKQVLAQRWEQAFVFFKHEDEASGPAEALRFRGLAENL
jgi:uncharacterized protein YecE (DUF72 family)